MVYAFLHLALALYRDYTTHKIYERRKSKHVIILLMEKNDYKTEEEEKKESEEERQTRDRKHRNGTRVGQIIRAHR